MVANFESEGFKQAMAYLNGDAAGRAVAETIVGEQLEDAKGLVKTAEEQVAEARILSEQQRIMKALQGDQVQEAQNMVDAQRLIRDAQRKSMEYLEDTNDILDDALAGLRAYNNQQTLINAKAEEQSRILGNEIALLTMIKQFGEESFAVQRLRSEIELENYKVGLQSAGIAGKMLDNLVAQKAAALGLKQEMAEIAALAQASLTFAPTSAVAAAMGKYAGRSTTSTKAPIFGDTGKSIYAKTRGSKSLTH